MMEVLFRSGNEDGVEEKEGSKGVKEDLIAQAPCSFSLKTTSSL